MVAISPIATAPSSKAAVLVLRPTPVQYGTPAATKPGLSKQSTDPKREGGRLGDVVKQQRTNERTNGGGFWAFGMT